MKHYLLTAVSATVLAATSFAGEVVTHKEVARPELIYGRGFYFGVQAGVNAYQDFGGTRRLELGGNDIALEPREKVGFVGGIKLGYVFGEGSVRPAIEADVFYNGVEGDLDLRVNGDTTDFNADAKLHSGAALLNFIARFGTGQFQPYIGAGLGGFYAEVDDVNVRINGTDYHADGGSNSGFAWQLLAGADYYFTETSSVFAEYKFLNYEDAGISEDRVSQHLFVLGLRWHF